MPRTASTAKPAPSRTRPRTSTGSRPKAAAGRTIRICEIGVSYRETAYAKINLALHVRARRDDGYHEIETVFAFVDAGDALSAEATEQDMLHVVGEIGRAL